MVMRTHKEVVKQAVKYYAQKYGSAEIDSLDWDDLDRLAYEVCDALDNYNGKELKDEQKALDAVRSDGGLMLTKSAKGGDYWATCRGKPIHTGTAKLLIERKFVKPVGGGLFSDAEPQLYQPVIV